MMNPKRQSRSSCGVKPFIGKILNESEPNDDENVSSADRAKKIHNQEYRQRKKRNIIGEQHDWNNVILHLPATL